MAKQSVKTEQVGKVFVRYLQTGERDEPVYSDGVGEDRLYMKFKRDPNYTGHQADGQFSSWVEEYHLSPVRHHLLKWFPFDSNGTVLEVGAGCGALTGLLCRRLNKVTALEYSRQRALITAMRHSQCSNLEVIVGGLQDLEGDCEFDYITVIGVLEYAGTFYGGEVPYKSFLTKLRGMLKPTGTLILAIENKIGIKYICGAQEDHTGKVFDSIYDYPYSSKVRTFSKKELAELLQAAGFCYREWYYPVPDYKMPQDVISEKITPGDLDSIWGLFPARTGRRRRREVLSEKRLGKTLAKAGLFGEFANSFLVIARTKDAGGESRCLRFIGANSMRKQEFRTNKTIWQQGREKSFILNADNSKSAEFLQDIVNKEVLAKKFFSNNAEVVTGRLSSGGLVYPYITFPSLADLIGRAISDGDLRFGRSWIDEYLRFLLTLPTEHCVPREFMRELGIPDSEVTKNLCCLSCGIVDCVPHNILISEENKKWYIIDNEFTYSFPIPIDFLICRAIRTLVVDLQDRIQSQVCEKRPVVILSGHGKNRHYIPLTWLDVLTNLDVSPKQQARWCAAFQNKVLHHKCRPHGRLKSKSRVLRYVPIAELTLHQGFVEQVYRSLRKVRRMFRMITTLL